jgi:hypothetical protein
MKAKVTLVVKDGQTTCGPAVKFKATVIDDDDASAVGAAIAAAVDGVGVCRPLVALAKAIRLMEGDTTEAEIALVQAARECIDDWRKRDEELKVSIR